MKIQTIHLKPVEIDHLLERVDRLNKEILIELNKHIPDVRVIEQNLISINNINRWILCKKQVKK